MHQIDLAEADAGGFSEHNLDTTNYDTRQKLHKAMKLTSNHYKLQAGFSNIPAIREYKPGGTLTFIRNHLSARVVDKGSDPMGRWTYIRLKCRGQRHVVIITAYQPCKGKPKPDGSMTVINQHYSILLQQKAK
jgi:hypothetical protein